MNKTALIALDYLSKSNIKIHLTPCQPLEIYTDLAKRSFFYRPQEEYLRDNDIND